jgi:hypothetical protein
VYDELAAFNEYTAAKNARYDAFNKALADNNIKLADFSKHSFDIAGEKIDVFSLMYIWNSPFNGRRMNAVKGGWFLTGEMQAKMEKRPELREGIEALAESGYESALEAWRAFAKTEDGAKFEKILEFFQDDFEREREGGMKDFLMREWNIAPESESSYMPIQRRAHSKDETGADSGACRA